MKKAYIIPLIASASILASCTVPGASTPSDYTSLYNANVKAELAKLDETIKTLTPKPKEVVGTLSGMIEMNTLTGAEQYSPQKVTFGTDYEVVAENTQNTQSTLRNAKASVIAKESAADVTLDMAAKDASIVTALLGNYLKYSGVTATVSTANEEVKKSMQSEIDASLKKITSYENKWINITDNGELPPEAKQVLTKLASLKSADLEKYLTTYQIISQNGSGTTLDSKVTFPVKLNTENAVSLMSAVVTDMYGSGVTEEQKTEMRNAVSKLSLTGTVTYDTKDALYSDSKYVISHPDAPMTLKLDIARKGNVMSIGMTPVQGTNEVGKFLLTSTTSGNNSDFVAKVSLLQNAQALDVAVLSGAIADHTLKNMSGFASVPGMLDSKLSYTYKNNFTLTANANGSELVNISNTYAGENFSGKAIVQGQEAANWKVDFAGNTLSALTMLVKNIMNPEAKADLVNINLTKKEGTDMVTGKAQYTIDEANSGSADMTLQYVSKEKFGIMLHNILMTPAESSVVKTLELFTQWKESDTSKKVEIPTNAVSYSEFEKAINSDATSTGGEVTTVHSGATLSGTTASGTVEPMYPTVPLNTQQNAQTGASQN